jgi:hypothetical protein
VTHHDAPFAAGLPVHHDGAPTPWAVTPVHGVVQGPLDLAFFARDHLRLTLQDGQLALVERAGVLENILGAGVHDVHCDGSGRAFFVHPDQPVNWQWDDGAVLWIGPRTSRRAVPIIGACTVTVADVATFYGAFLRGARSLEDGCWQRMLDALVRGRLESRLGRVTDGGEADPGAVQTLLARIAAADLTEDLDEYGLACLHLAVDTQQAPVVEGSLAGHFPGHRDNDA